MGTNNNKKTHKDNSKNLFQIMDEIIDQLNSTKKLFIAMILTVMIIPPAVFVITFELLDFNAGTLHSFEENHHKVDHREGFFLRNDTLLFGLMRNAPLIIGLLWLGVGIRQWIVLSKWNKRYQKYKELQKKIDEEMMEDKGNNTTENNHRTSDNSNSRGKG
jgi:hypothetical protein